VQPTYLYGASAVNIATGLSTVPNCTVCTLSRLL